MSLFNLVQLDDTMQQYLSSQHIDTTGMTLVRYLKTWNALIEPISYRHPETSVTYIQFSPEQQTLLGVTSEEVQYCKLRGLVMKFVSSP
jgi:hypothetical protein